MTVMYFCDHGFDMEVGSKYSTIRKAGKWSKIFKTEGYEETEFQICDTAPADKPIIRTGKLKITSVRSKQFQKVTAVRDVSSNADPLLKNNPERIERVIQIAYPGIQPDDMVEIVTFEVIE